MYILNKIKHLESWQKNLIVLWFASYIGWASYSMIMPFLPIFLLNDLSTPAETVTYWSGITFSATFLSGIFMSPVWGALADKIGKKKITVFTGFSVGIIYVFYSLIQTPEQLLILRFIHGAVAGFTATSLSLVADSLPKEKLGWGLGLMQVAGSGGSITGPLLGGFLANAFGIRLSFVVAGILFICGAVTVHILVKAPQSTNSLKQNTIKENFGIAWKNKPLLYMLTLSSIISMGAMSIQPILPMHIINLQGSSNNAVMISGILFSLTGITGIIAAPLWGMYGQRKGFRDTLFIVILGIGTIQTLQAFSFNIPSFAIIQLLLGCFVAGAGPSINSLLVELAGNDFRGRAFGLATSFNQLGAMLGPLLGGAIGGFLGIKYVFLSAGVIILICAFSVRRLFRKY